MEESIVDKLRARLRSGDLDGEDVDVDVYGYANAFAPKGKPNTVAQPAKPIFRPGDVVRLKSGGPDMSVERLAHPDGVDSARCHWFDGDRLQPPAWLPLEALDLVSTDETRKAEKAAAEKMDKAFAELNEAVNRTKPHLRDLGRPFKPDVPGTMDDPRASGLFREAGGTLRDEPTLPEGWTVERGWENEPIPVVSDELANSPLVKRATADAKGLAVARVNAWTDVRDASSAKLANAIEAMIAAHRRSE